MIAVTICGSGVMTRRLNKAERHQAAASCRAMFEDGKVERHVTYLASGRYSDCFAVRTSATTTVVAKVSSYREGCLRAMARSMKAGDYKRAEGILMGDAVSISKHVCMVTNLMLARHVTPHLVWSFGGVDARGFYHSALNTHLGPPVRKRLKEFGKDKARLQSRWSHISFHERFHSDLTDFLHATHITSYALKCIIFQVVYTVACLQQTMPGFRHNDLSSNNVFVNYDNKAEPSCTRYCVFDTTMYTAIPNILVAVADWDFAHCRDIVTYTGDPISLQNERIVSGAYNLKPRLNATYDVHFFLTNLLPLVMTRPRAHAETINFIRMVTGRWSDRVDILLPRLEPCRVLQHDYFKELQERPDITLSATYRDHNTSASISSSGPSY